MVHIIVVSHTFDRFTSAYIEVGNQKEELHCPSVFVYGDVKELIIGFIHLINENTQCRKSLFINL